MTVRILHGDCRDVLKTLPDASVHCLVTSPPYWGLRDYGVAGQLGLEKTPDEYVANMVEVFREVRRVLRDDGTLWLNLGDSYAGSWGAQSRPGYSDSSINLEGGSTLSARQIAAHPKTTLTGSIKNNPGLKPKDLVGIPWMLAFALRADGWYLRKDIIWCLSGGTRVYARTQKGEMPMTIKDMVRLNPATVQLWSGKKWTQALGWNEMPRPDRTYEIEIRSGQRIGCLAGHLWPTLHGDVRADALSVGDIIRTCRLPQPDAPKRPAALDDQTVGWLVGLYIAEGSQSDGTIQIASHQSEDIRFDKLRRIADDFHATAAVHKTSDNGCTVNLNGPVLNGIINTYVSGRIASDKHLHPRCWQRSDEFLSAVLDGYLSGDGHWDSANERWRLGFCNNDELVADLRTIGARVGASVRLKRVVHKIGDAEFPGYKGEVRFSRNVHHSSRDDGEVVAIRESRARKFWDIGVADEPHLFALASGVLTHNSKPNPMPESATDRPTSSHEHVFLLAKSERYFFDAEAVAEPALQPAGVARKTGQGKMDIMRALGTRNTNGTGTASSLGSNQGGCTRNVRDVWTIATAPFSEAHFATFPPELAERCIKAGTSEKGCCQFCRAPWVRVITKGEPDLAHQRASGGDANGEYAGQSTKNHDAVGVQNASDVKRRLLEGMREKIYDWRPSCGCPIQAGVMPCTVLDPFSGAGTTALVADRLGRDAIGIELSAEYIEISKRRLSRDVGMFADIAAD